MIIKALNHFMVPQYFNDVENTIPQNKPLFSFSFYENPFIKINKY